MKQYGRAWRVVRPGQAMGESGWKTIDKVNRGYRVMKQC